MSTAADSVIDELRTGHDQLVSLVAPMTGEQLRGPTAATEWTIADVLSHLGSGAEIGLAALDAAITGVDPRTDAFNPGVWDRWNAMAPEAQRDGFLAANAVLVERFESLDDDARSQLRVDMKFLPPVDVATAAGFRLSEFALHSWDIRVAADPGATLTPTAAEILLPQLAFMFGFIAKPGALGERTADLLVRTTDPGQRFGVAFGEGVSLSDPVAFPDAELQLPAETWVRLVTGRLGPEHTPSNVTLTGDITLDDLRRTFPGY